MKKQIRFDSSTQDKTLKLLLTDTEFIKEIYGFMKPEYFSSELLKKLAEATFSFYNTYNVAPNFEQLDKLLLEMVAQNVISDDEIDVYVSYIDKLWFRVKTDLTVKNYLIDNLRSFSKQRVLDVVSKIIIKDKESGIDVDNTFSKVTQAVEEIRGIDSSESSLVSIEDLMKVSYYTTGEVVSYTGIEVIDRQLGGGLQRGLFYVVLGYTGAGKTWFLIHLGKMAARLGYLVLHIVIELSNKVVLKRYKMAMAGKEAKNLSSDYKYVNKIVKKSLVKRSNIIFVDEEEKSASVDSLGSIVDRVKKKFGREPDLILIDSAEDYLPPSGRKYKDDWDAEKATATYLKNFARDRDICIVSTIQAVKQSENVEWLGPKHGSGSAAKMRRASVGISINSSAKEQEQGMYRAYIFKNVEGEKGARAWVKRDWKHGQSVLESGRWKRSESGEKDLLIKKEE